VAVEHEVRLPAAPQEVLAELTHPDFLRAYAAELGVRAEAVETSAVNGTRRTTVRLGVPTLGILPVFTRFVGSRVTVVDTRTWRRDGGPGAVAEVDVEAEILGRAASVRGRRVLTPDDEGGTRLTTTARVRVEAPFVGRQAEAAVAELVPVVLRRELALLSRRLGLPPGTDPVGDG
jgi:uncharacterized protein YndB with AHSA1/START domain